MYAVILKAIGFVVMVAMGYFSKKIGLLKSEDSTVLGKLVMNFALPCALIGGFSGVSFNALMVLALAFGFAFNLLGVAMAKLTAWKGQSRITTATNMFCCAGLNIGSFALPFCQSFFPPAAMGYLVMFDIGNCIMILGGTSAFAEKELTGQSRLDVKKLLKSLFSSVPFDVYFVLVLASIFHYTFPAPLLDIAAMIAPANVFIIMFMLGLKLDLKLNFSELKSVAKIVVNRLTLGVLLAVLLHFLPVEEAFCNVLTIIVFSPMASPTIIYVEKAKCDTKLTAMAGSVTIPIAIVCFVALMLVLL